MGKKTLISFEIINPLFSKLKAKYGYKTNTPDLLAAGDREREKQWERAVLP